MTSETFKNTTGEPFCKKLDKLPDFLSAKDLFQALLHLAGWNEYFFDKSTGDVSSDRGGILGVFQRAYKDRGIYIYGFTNKDAGGLAKIYTDLFNLNKDLGNFYIRWRARGLGPGAPPAAALPSVDNYIKTFHPDFLENKASAYDIDTWKLVGARQVIVRARDPTDEKVGARKYRFTFQVPGDRKTISLDFAADDIIFFCSYESIKTIEQKERKISDYKRGSPVPAELLKLYKDQDQEYEEATCADPNYDGKEIKVENLVNQIDHIDVLNKTWKKVNSTTWRANGIKNAKNVNFIFGYKFGIPMQLTDIGISDELRLIEIERMVDDIWRLRLRQIKKRSAFYETNPEFDVYLTNDQDVSLCAPR